MIVVAWCRIRSRIALAITRSPKTSPQLPKLWLLVRIVWAVWTRDVAFAA